VRKTIFVACCLTICAVALFGGEQQRLKVKTGLWQIDQTMSYSGLPPQMQAMIDRLTPEQQAAMGIHGKLTRNSCVTEKNLNTAWAEGDQSCKWTIVKSTDTDLEVNGTSCKMGMNEGWKSGVLYKLHALDPEHLQGSMHGTATGAGVDATLDGTYKAKWIAETCSENSK